MGEARYIQPMIKAKTGIYNNPGITDESYPYTFKMEVDGIDTGNGRAVYCAFQGDAVENNGWGGYNNKELYAVMTFEKPLRIMRMEVTFTRSTVKCIVALYGIPDGDDPVTGGVLLGKLSTNGVLMEPQVLNTTNLTYFKRYRIDWTGRGVWHIMGGVKLDALYRPADIHP